MNGLGDGWPSVDTIAEYVGCSARTIQRLLPKLVAAGILVARLRRGASTVYRLAKDILKRLLGDDSSAVDPRQNANRGATKHGATPDSQTGDVSPEVALEVAKPPKRAPRGRWPFGRSQNQTPAPMIGSPSPGNSPVHETFRPSRTALCGRHGGRRDVTPSASHCQPCAIDARLNG
ncbi:helix-turn-helix domain-containing protein [Actinoplanes sp. CA-054009]